MVTLASLDRFARLGASWVSPSVADEAGCDRTCRGRGAVRMGRPQVKPPKDRLIKDFTLNWRPNSDIVYVFETDANNFFGPVSGMYEKQTITHNKKFLYRQVRVTRPWGRGGQRGPGGK